MNIVKQIKYFIKNGKIDRKTAAITLANTSNFQLGDMVRLQKDTYFEDVIIKELTETTLTIEFKNLANILQFYPKIYRLANVFQKRQGLLNEN